MEVALAWIILSLIVAFLFKYTTLGFWTCFLICMFTSPVLGFIFACFYPSKEKIAEEKQPSLELRHLADLKEKGLIDDDEYEKLKESMTVTN